MKMNSAARKRKIPTLCERVEALREELDEVLDQLAEERRPKGEGRAIPAPCMRLEMDIRGGHCLCRSYLAVIKP
jgi:hypothetical protein